MKNRFVPLFISLLILIGIGSCTVLEKKEYDIVHCEKERHDLLVSFLEDKKEKKTIQDYGFDSTDSELWVRYFPKKAEIKDTVENFLANKDLLSIDEENIIDSTTVTNELVDSLQGNNSIKPVVNNVQEQGQKELQVQDSSATVVQPEQESENTDSLNVIN